MVVVDLGEVTSIYAGKPILSVEKGTTRRIRWGYGKKTKARRERETKISNITTNNQSILEESKF
jgi:hypothetical protein